MQYNASMPIDHRWWSIDHPVALAPESVISTSVTSAPTGKRIDVVRSGLALIERDALGGAVSERVHVSVPGLGGSHLDGELGMRAPLPTGGGQ